MIFSWWLVTALIFVLAFFLCWLFMAFLWHQHPLLFHSPEHYKPDAFLPVLLYFCLCFIRNMSKDEFIYQYFNYCLSELNQKEHLWVFFMYILSCCQAVPLIRKHCFFCYIYFLFDVYLCLKEDKRWFYS